MREKGWGKLLSMKKSKGKHLEPNHVLLIGFLVIILLGSLLLSLPIAHNRGISLAYVDALFISASAVCVTGLVTVDVALTFSLFGRTVIAFLILLGGLGFASIVISFSLLLGMNVNLSQRLFIKEAYNLSSMKGTLSIVRAVLISSFLIQGLGTVVEYFVFVQTYSPLDAFGHALFNTISAFNNAGFDLMGGYLSLSAYQGNVVMNLTTAVLIILGGTGFFVLADIARNRKWSNLSMHSRIVLLMNGTLITLGFLFFVAVEKLTPLAAFFQSVTTRTAGFNTVDISSFSQAGLLFAMLLMFIGASPGSTGGGIKTTTTFALLLSLGSLMFRRESAAFKRKVSGQSILKAFQVLLLSFLLVLLGSLSLLLIEQDAFDFVAVLFETVSAFATVGLSCGITPSLSTLSKVVLVVIMFAGRVGPITIATSLKAKSSHLGYIEEQIFIG
jgi:trk system potassium uptake protein TrkH